MEYSSAWLCLLKAQDEYFTSYFAFTQDEAVMMSDLSLALTTDDREVALRLLSEMLPRIELIGSLLPAIMDAAIDSSRIPTIMLSREVLQHYREEPWVRSSIQACVATYLAENDEWHYRRITELYEVLDYEEELASFLLLCQANANPEIQEITDNASLKR